VNPEAGGFRSHYDRTREQQQDQNRFHSFDPFTVSSGTRAQKWRTDFLL
jgi:hypothetical protein